MRKDEIVALTRIGYERERWDGSQCRRPFARSRRDSARGGPGDRVRTRSERSSRSGLRELVRARGFESPTTRSRTLLLPRRPAAPTRRVKRRRCSRERFPAEGRAWLRARPTDLHGNLRRRALSVAVCRLDRRTRLRRNNRGLQWRALSL